MTEPVKQISRKALSLLLSISMLFGMVQSAGVTAFAEETKNSGYKNSAMLLSTLQNSSRTVLYLDDGNIVFSSNSVRVNGAVVTANSSGYIITQKDSGANALVNTISVTDGTQNITLQNMNIDVSGTSGACAFSIAAGASVNLTLEDESKLKSGANCAGLQVPGDSDSPDDKTKNGSLTITSDSTGSLNVTGGDDSSGIGGGPIGITGFAAGLIKISGGTVKAYGGGGNSKHGDVGGAGIGSGKWGGGGTIIIDGGNVEATGGTPIYSKSPRSGAGIGSGGSAQQGVTRITISGGTVTATGGRGSAGIGSGCSSHSSVTSVFKGGTVTAYGGKNNLGGGVDAGSGIGSDSSVCPNRVIKNYFCGSKVKATGADGNHGGAGIGGCGVENYFSDGIVEATGGAGYNSTIYGGYTSGAGIGGGAINSYDAGISVDGVKNYFSGGTVTAKGGTDSADIGGSFKVYDTMVRNYFSGGSIQADNAKPQPVLSKDDSTSIYKTQLTLYGVTSETKVTCKANGSEFPAYTDKQGKLYLWLPAGNQKVVIKNEGDSVLYGGTVSIDGESVLSVISTECSVTGVTVPEDATVSGTDITAQVGNGTASLTFDISVSLGASWKLYSDQNCQSEIADKAMNLNAGENTEYLKVTAQDGTTVKIYRLKITRGASSDANLAGLSVKANGENVPLSPAFGANILNYTANVGSGVSEVMVAPAVSEPSATFTVNGKTPTVGQTSVNITLNEAGQTTPISVKVTAQDGTTVKIYTLNIVRAASGSSGNSSHSSSTSSLPSSVTDTPTNTTVDLSGATFAAWVTGISLSASPLSSGGVSDVSDQTVNTVYHLAVSQTELNVIGSPFVYNIRLLDQNGNPVSFNGSVTVKVAIPAGIHGTPHIFRYEESTGTFTDLGATVQDGYLVFTTTHFSYYVIAGTGDSITLDTKCYQMPVGGSYQIGVRLTGSKATAVKAHSTNDKIAVVTKLKNGNYQVTGSGTGTVWIMFDVYDSKNKLLTHVSTRVDVKTGIRPRGDSTRQISVF